jgi:hypothetical protein
MVHFHFLIQKSTSQNKKGKGDYEDPGVRARRKVCENNDYDGQDNDAARDDRQEEPVTANINVGVTSGIKSARRTKHLTNLNKRCYRPHPKYS